ncbi:transcriptional regulator opi1 [Amphichorda felina]
MASVVGQHPASQWPASNPLMQHPGFVAPSRPAQYKADSPLTMDLDTASNSAASAASPDSRSHGRAGSVNLDDPDVWLAAEALGDLRADFVSSPPNSSGVLPSPPAPTAQPPKTKPSRNAEPLFSLLTTSHPLLATTITGATSAYGGAKNFSPRFKSGAEYVEGYLTPIANTVGSVGRVTGVEGGVRWFLGAGRRHGSDLEAGSSKKRRKVDPAGPEPITKKRAEAEGLVALSQVPAEAGSLEDSFPSTPKGERRPSFASTVDTLPAYDDMRSPAYSESMDSQAQSRANRANAPWQSRLVMSTSGLGVAMSDESLRSLKYCLRWLRWANEHIGGVIGTLKTTLEQYERPEDKDMAQWESTERDAAALEALVDPNNDNQEPKPSRAELVSRINSLKSDVLKTLQDAITMVSRYAGGALPENARVLVRRHLTSLPHRFRLATMTENDEGQISAQDSDSAVREGAQKVLVLAKEGLDMVSQVSGIVDGTIVSAEEWCERMGKKKRRDSRDADNRPVLPTQMEPNGDVKMN